MSAARAGVKKFRIIRPDGTRWIVEGEDIVDAIRDAQRTGGVSSVDNC